MSRFPDRVTNPLESLLYNLHNPKSPLLTVDTYFWRVGGYASSKKQKENFAQTTIGKGKLEMEDDLRTEYDLKSLQVRRLGSGRKSFGSTTVRLELDVAEMFPSADAVNEALDLLPTE